MDTTKEFHATMYLFLSLVLALLVLFSQAAESGNESLIRGGGGATSAGLPDDIHNFHRILYDEPNYCVFNQATCGDLYLTECKSLADKVESEWCTNVNSGAHACCGSYDDCCTHNKILYTVVIFGCILVVFAAILSCCYFMASCPLRQFIEERQAKSQS